MSTPKRARRCEQRLSAIRPLVWQRVPAGKSPQGRGPKVYHSCTSTPLPGTPRM